nr:hypothetical protein CFP56_32753 [Quercus suber]
MRATTPNLARKSEVRVAGLEDYDSDSVCSEKSDEGLERDNPDHERVMAPSTEIEQGIVDDGNISLGHDVSLEALQNVNVISRARMDSGSEFQVQLGEIDRELARFDKSEGGLKENVVVFSSEARQTPLPRDVISDGLIDGVGQDGVKKKGKGKPKSGYTRSIIWNQAKGKGDFKVGSPKEGTSLGPLKRSFGDMDGLARSQKAARSKEG